MVASIVIGIIIFIVLLVIYLEYRNEKKYQAERQRRKERKKRKLTPKVTKRPTQKPTEEKEKKRAAPSVKTAPKAPQKPSVKAKNEEKGRTPPPPRKTAEIQKAGEKPLSTPKERETQKPQPSTQKPLPPKKAAPITQELPREDLPSGEYPAFNYDRLLKMGLSEEEAHAFIQELIPQIGEQIPLLDEAMKIPDFHQMERLTHSIKGSSTTIGTGGVSDLLVEYNTYLKEGKEVRIAEVYQKYLKHYYEKLKKQFPENYTPAEQ
jgi:hypothetical protein